MAETAPTVPKREIFNPQTVTKRLKKVLGSIQGVINELKQQSEDNNIFASGYYLGYDLNLSVWRTREFIDCIDITEM